MEYLMIVLFIGYFFEKVLMQWYQISTERPFFSTNCTETHVVNIIHCVAFVRASKNVRFFFNAGNNSCQWNCIFLYENNTLADEWNHYVIETKQKTAPLDVLGVSASSIYANDHSLWGVHFATDGMMPNSDVNIFSSQQEQSPWLMITLARSFTVQFVRIFNRRNQLGSRFHDVALEVSNNGNTFDRKGFYKGPGITNQVIDILLDNPTIGQYVRIRITQGLNNFLHFVEIEVYNLDYKIYMRAISVLLATTEMTTQS